MPYDELVMQLAAKKWVNNKKLIPYKSIGELVFVMFMRIQKNLLYYDEIHCFKMNHYQLFIKLIKR